MSFGEFEWYFGHLQPRSPDEHLQQDLETPGAKRGGVDPGWAPARTPAAAGVATALLRAPAVTWPGGGLRRGPWDAVCGKPTHSAAPRPSKRQTCRQHVSCYLPPSYLWFRRDSWASRACPAVPPCGDTLSRRSSSPNTTAGGPASPPLPTAVEDACLGACPRGFMMESGTWLGGDDGAVGWARRAGPGHRVPARCGVPAHFLS